MYPEEAGLKQCNTENPGIVFAGIERLVIAFYYRAVNY